MREGLEYELTDGHRRRGREIADRDVNLVVLLDRRTGFEVEAGERLIELAAVQGRVGRGVKQRRELEHPGGGDRAHRPITAIGAVDADLETKYVGPRTDVL